jgi:glycopeptide antibiotics resistance protein
MLTGKRNILIVLFLIYLALFTIVSFLGIDIHKLRTPDSEVIRSNLVPFRAISDFVFNFEHYNFDTWFYNTLGPIILFLPLGFLLPSVFLNLKTFKRVIFLSLLLSTCIEGIQFITKLGVLDIDDIILNLGGAALGYSLFRMFFKK